MTSATYIISRDNGTEQRFISFNCHQQHNPKDRQQLLTRFLGIGIQDAGLDRKLIIMVDLIDE